MDIIKKKASLYLRFSDPKQIGNTSLETQEQVCRNACLAEGFEIVDIVKNEAVSASKTNTERIIELLDYCKKNRSKFEVLVVFKLDRFARSQEHHHWLRGQLLKLGIILRSATERIDESPSGRLVEGVLAAVNEYDNEVKRERVKLAMWARVEQGLWPWGAPTGYKEVHEAGVKLSPRVFDETCKDAVIKVFERYSTGAVSKTDLAKEFSKKIIRNFKGKRVIFSKQSMHNILNNIYYTGFLRNKEGKLIQGKHQKLIDITLYEKCQQVQVGLSNHATRKRQHIHPDFPLRRFVLCGYCNEPLTACWAKSGQYPYYYCYNKNCSKSSVSIKKVDIETLFRAYIAKVKPAEDFIPVFNVVFIKRYEQREKEIKGDYLDQVAEIHKLQKDEDYYVQSGKNGILPAHIVKKNVDETEEKITLAKMKLTEIHAEELDVNALLNFAYDFIRTIENVWYYAPIQYKIKLQRLIFPEGVCYTEKGFSNSKISRAFKLIDDITTSQSNVVSRVGFEPTTDGLRVHCSTVELSARVKTKVNYT